MLQTEEFKMRISPQEKAMLGAVARHLQRSQAGTIKLLVREVYELIANEKNTDPKTTQKERAAL